jgi:hypothetical protein
VAQRCLVTLSRSNAPWPIENALLALGRGRRWQIAPAAMPQRGDHGMDWRWLFRPASWTSSICLGSALFVALLIVDRAVGHLSWPVLLPTIIVVVAAWTAINEWWRRRKL